MIINRLFENPFIYTHFRKMAAGSQNGTKRFISDYLMKYSCESVMDLCCGTGDFAPCIGDIYYLGLDNNRVFIDYAKLRFRGQKNIQFKCCDILRTPIGNKYDAAILVSAVHHFSDKDMEVIIRLLKQYIKKIIIVADIIPNPPSAIGRWLVKLDRGEKIRTAEEKIELFKKDFDIIKTQLIPSLFAYQFGIVAIHRKK